MTRKQDGTKIKSDLWSQVFAAAFVRFTRDRSEHIAFEQAAKLADDAHRLMYGKGRT